MAQPDVDPSLLHLLIKEPIYVLPEDRPAPQPEAASAAAPPVAAAPEQGPLAVPAQGGLPSVPKLPAMAKAAGVAAGALPAVPARGLALLVHHPAGKLEEPLATMLQKLALATEPNAELHLHLVGDMATYTWPQAWHPWAARLTLLLGWPPALLARHRVAEPFRLLTFASARVIAAPHPAELEADRGLKSKLWALIQEAKS